MDFDKIMEKLQFGMIGQEFEYLSTTIDKLIITHPHADHLGGAYAVFKNFEVKEVYDNGDPTTTQTYKTYLKNIKEKKIKYQHAEIHFVGGEPTMLGLEFFQRNIPKFKEIVKQAGFSAEVMMISNLLHDDILEIAKLFDRVTTSYEVDSRFVSLKGVYKPILEKRWVKDRS